MQRYMKQNERKKRDFHRHVRVVYRACRKLYSLERTQDECLKLFMILFPEYYKARLSEDKYYRLSDTNYDKVVSLLTKWMPEEGVLHDLICDVINELDRLMLREEFVTYCEDITPVAMAIRKLTPTECLRLMDCDEETIKILMHCGLSNSSVYKLAGNSICVGVMTALFEKLVVNTEQEKVEGMQLSFF